MAEGRVFAGPWIPVGCKTLVCENPFNAKANEALARGNPEGVLPFCAKINRLDTPALIMPDAYLVCAKAGNIRKMGGLATYYREVDFQPDQIFYWASRGAMNIGVRKGGGPIPHPDSKQGWRELCAAYRWGWGTAADFKKAGHFCAVAIGDVFHPEDDLAKKWGDEMDDEEEARHGKARFESEAAREWMQEHLLERARNNYR